MARHDEASSVLHDAPLASRPRPIPFKIGPAPGPCRPGPGPRGFQDGACYAISNAWQGPGAGIGWHTLCLSTRDHERFAL